MPMGRVYKTSAIVLSRFDLGEADRVLTLLTPHDGKLKAIAKGVRRPRSRLGGSLEPFAELHLVLAHGRTFDVVLGATYEHLDAGLPPGRVARWFEFRFTDELGLRPEVDRCVECDRRLESDEAFRWVPALGGLLCRAHPGPNAERTGLSRDGLRLLKAYRHMDLETIAALTLPPAVEREAEQAMRMFVRHVLEREARSLDFLDEVRAGH